MFLTLGSHLFIYHVAEYSYVQNIMEENQGNGFSDQMMLDFSISIGGKEKIGLGPTQ